MVDTCELVKSVVENCGELWNRCHTSREVRRMRDMHIEALVRQYGEQGELDACDLVQEYRHSGRTLDDPVEDVTCTDEKTIEVQTKFQTCSHSTATSVYQTIQDLTSIKIISDKLCKALTTIGTVCIKHLYQCFAEDDVRQMRKSHLQEMKTFLLRISEEKVTADVFENCKVMEYTENEEQEGIVIHQLDNDMVDMGSEESVENNNSKDEGITVKSIMKILPGDDTETDISEKSDFHITTTEESSNGKVKGARSVKYVGAISTKSETMNKLKEDDEYLSIKRVDNTDKEDTTKVYEEIKQADELSSDKGMSTPEEYTSGCKKRDDLVVTFLVTVMVMYRIW